MKCYPFIRCCGYAKGLLGIGLVGLGIYFYSQAPVLLDCNEFQKTCQPAFNKLIDDLAASNNPVEATGAENEFCDCWSSCMNYFQVYETRQDADEPGNCFLKSKALIPSTGTNNPQEPGDGSTGGTVVGLSSDSCSSCEDIDGNEDKLFNWLGSLALACGVSLFVLTACEHMELKWHNTSYSLCVLFTDMIVSGVLLVSVIVSFFSMFVAQAACDPDKMRKSLEDAGKDSTDGSADHAAAYANFMISMIEPMATELCDLRPHFTVYVVLSMTGFMCAFFSFIATVLLCCHCTADGEDHDHPHDFAAAEMKHLMNNHEYGSEH